MIINTVCYHPRICAIHSSTQADSIIASERPILPLGQRSGKQTELVQMQCVGHAVSDVLSGSFGDCSCSDCFDGAP